MMERIRDGLLIGLSILWVLASVSSQAQAQSNGLYRPDSVELQTPSPAPMQGLIIPRNQIVNIDTLVTNQYPAPEVYKRWWLEVQNCTGMKVDLEVSDFGWISVPGAGFILNGNKMPVPAWAAVEKRNVLILDRYLMNERLVKHEMTHLLMWETRKEASHTGEFWTRCQLIA